MVRFRVIDFVSRLRSVLTLLFCIRIQADDVRQSGVSETERGTWEKTVRYTINKNRNFVMLKKVIYVFGSRKSWKFMESKLHFPYTIHSRNGTRRGCIHFVCTFRHEVYYIQYWPQFEPQNFREPHVNIFSTMVNYQTKTCILP